MEGESEKVGEEREGGGVGMEVVGRWVRKGKLGKERESGGVGRVGE